MLDFVCHLATKVFFGKGQIEVLGKECRKYGNKVLVVSYGKASKSELKIYDDVISELENSGMTIWELKDVDPNPRVTSINAGARICKDNDIDLILAIGGGSVIDCSKAIGAAAHYEGDAWDLVLDNSKITDVTPIACVSTIAASGSETDGSAVISNSDTNEKLMIFNDGIRPKFAILDPTYTYSVPRYQTAVGTFDILCHAMETYFTNTPETYVQNRLAEALMKTCIEYGRIAIDDPSNYEARANLMWASSLVINGLLHCEKGNDWSTHTIEHEISAFFDVTHGAGVAVIAPAWMEYVLDESTVDNFVDFAVNVWGITPSDDKHSTARAGIAKLKEFRKDLGLPATLRDLGVTEDKFEAMAKGAVREGVISGGLKPLYYEDVMQIFKNAY
jgi:alcohol dehydrogenase YqhD (iron-dependent ADH family)